MRVIKPVTITDSSFISSTVAEPAAGETAWNAATAYALGARVIRTQTHRVYERLVAGTTATAPELDATNWVDVGPTARWAMFDAILGTATAGASPLTVTIAPGSVNAIALLGLVGTQATITVTDGPGGPTVYSRTVSLDGTQIVDWYSYYYEPYVQVEELVLIDLVPLSTARVTISITGSGTVKCGYVCVGTAYSLGDAEYGASLGIIDYSRKDTDEFGTTTFVRRDFSKRLSARLLLENTQLARVSRILTDLRATPAVWIGADDAVYAPATVFGFFRDFSIEIAYPTQSYCSLEIEGLT